MIKILVITVLAIAALLGLRRILELKPGTRRLAITVWVAFGPYDTAEVAEDNFLRACRAVLGPAGMVEHEKWVEAHVKNFRDWQAKGMFQHGYKEIKKAFLPLRLTAYGPAFQEACHKMRIEIEGAR